MWIQWSGMVLPIKFDKLLCHFHVKEPLWQGIFLSENLHVQIYF